MKPSEFIVEAKRAAPLDAQSKVSPGTVFTTDGYVDLYRATGLIARLPAWADDIDPYSFVIGRPMLVTYTDEERDMIRKAFKKMGIDFNEEMQKGSEEPEGVNNVSPTQGFKGYPR
jgi:hypothetical protein